MEKKEFLHSINYFRGLAIILVIMLHVYYRINFNMSERNVYILRNLIDGGEHLFVFISGFIFHYKVYKKFNFKSFYLNRFKRLFIPYMLLGIPVIFFYVFHEKGPVHDYFFNYEGESGFLFYFIPFVKYFLTGRMLMPFWYIPFIMTLYLASPLFVVYIRLRLRLQLFILAGLLFISMAIHRPYLAVNHFHHAIYFMPVFLSGILFSQYRNVLLNFFETNYRYVYLFAGSFSLALIKVFVFDQAGSQFKHIDEFTIPDLLIISKLLLSVGILSFLSRFDKENHSPFKLISTLALLSFPVYFLHQFFIEFFYRYNLLDFLPDYGIFKLFFVTTFIIFLSLVAAQLIKYFFRGHSKYIIGY